MRMLFIIVYYAVALLGCSEPRQVTDVRRDINGSHFHGRVEAREGISRFECLDSATGACRFFVHDTECLSVASAAAACEPALIDQVDVRSGESREVVGLPHSVRVCLAVDGSGRC